MARNSHCRWNHLLGNRNFIRLSCVLLLSLDNFAVLSLVIFLKVHYIALTFLLLFCVFFYQRQIKFLFLLLMPVKRTKKIEKKEKDVFLQTANEQISNMKANNNISTCLSTIRIDNA